MFVTMAVHHPQAEHVEDFLAFMKRIEREMEGTPGLLSIESFREAGGERLVAIGGRDPEWSAAPDELFQLSAA